MFLDAYISVSVTTNIVITAKIKFTIPTGEYVEGQNNDTNVNTQCFWKFDNRITKIKFQTNIF